MSEYALELREEREREHQRFMDFSYDQDYSYEQYEAERAWFEHHPFLETYSVFAEKLRSLKRMVSRQEDPDPDNMLQKMAYVHAVTLFEAMVGDVLKATVLAYPHLMHRMATKLGDDKKYKYELPKIAKLGLEGIILEIINAQLYHNPVTVKHHVSTVSGWPLPDSHMAAMQLVIDIRHDLVHRDGKTITGGLHHIDSIAVHRCIAVIEDFANDIFETLDTAVKEIPLHSHPRHAELLKGE